MAIPTRPVAPPKALRSNPDTFSANAEANIIYQWDVLPDWLEEIAAFNQAQADAALAAALGGDLPVLTDQAGKFLRVNSGGTAAEFKKALALTEESDGSELALSGFARTLLDDADADAARATLGVGLVAGAALVSIGHTSVGAGTTFEINGIPAGTSEIDIVFYRVSQTGAGDMLVQLGNSSGWATFTYQSASAAFDTAMSAKESGSGLIIGVGNAGLTGYGIMQIRKSFNTNWIGTHVFHFDGGSGPIVAQGAGWADQSGTLSRLRVMLTTGNFDNGYIGVYCR